MTSCAKTCISMLAVLLSATVASAANRITGFGTMFSAKAVGLSAEIDRGAYTTRFSLLCDIGGTLVGNSDYPGIKAVYNFEYVFRRWDIMEGGELAFFSGPGLSAGYVCNTCDFHHGFMAALYGNTGIRLSLPTKIDIIFSFSGELGFHTRFNNKYDNSMKLYHTGLEGIVYPELSIIYRF